MTSKYKIGQKVIYKGRKCKIFATKAEQLPEHLSPYNEEIIPEKDYLVFFFFEINRDGHEEYRDFEEANEHELTAEEWAGDKWANGYSPNGVKN